MPKAKSGELGNYVYEAARPSRPRQARPRRHRNRRAGAHRLHRSSPLRPDDFARNAPSSMTTLVQRSRASNRCRKISTPHYLRKALKGKRTPIKSALLDQRVVAGLGNIYVCEALFRAGISPKRPAAKMRPANRAHWLRTSKRCCEQAIKAGGSSLRDYASTDGGSANSSTASPSTTAKASPARRGLQRHDQTHRAGWPFQLLLPFLPDVTSALFRPGLGLFQRLAGFQQTLQARKDHRPTI